MNDIRRTLLWGVFFFSLFMLWSQWEIYNGRGQQQQTQQTSAGGNAEIPSATVNTTGNAAQSELPQTENAAQAGENITVTTDVYQIQFNTVGATITDLQLLKFVDQIDKSKVIHLFDPLYAYVPQIGVMVSGTSPENWLTHDKAMNFVPGETTLAEGKDSLTVKFASEPLGGLKMVREYIFTRSSYEIKTNTYIENVSDSPITPNIYYRLVRNSTELPGKSMFSQTFTGFAYYTDENKYKKVSFSDIAKNKVNVNEIKGSGWVGMAQHYFVSAWLLPSDVSREYRVWQLPNNRYSIGMEVPLGVIAPGQTVQANATLYAGPQEEKVLEQLAPGLDLVKDYGMFRVLSKPLFWLLYMLHGFLHNWGWAIVALVVLIKAAFYWLNARAYKSMAKMKAAAPRLQELRERYKDKPQQLQQEMMRIYREEKINPLGGCLPILVQIPVFIALYWVLLSSVEMRNAPWIGWITDLSQKDPYYILPIVMTASTLFQTWLNPTPPDPMQARMMWIMPMVFSVMFFMFPAGLVLYWITNNILSIAQQWFINKRLGIVRKK